MRAPTAFALVAAVLTVATGSDFRRTAAAETVLSVGIHTAQLGTLDPHRTGSTADVIVVPWLFNGLVRFKPGQLDLAAIEPDLATGWELSADELTWTFKLRQGVKFNQGFGEMTSDDVVFSLLRAADAKISAFASDYAGIASAVAVDRYTVRVTLKAPNPNFLTVLMNYQGGTIVSRRAVEELGEDYRIKAVGTGPFTVTGYQNGQMLNLAANPDYFRGAPRIDRIVYRYLPSDSSRELAYRAGEIDVMFGPLNQRWTDRVSAIPDTIVDSIQPKALAQLHLNATHKPLDDIRVRQAVVHAVNRPELARFMGRGVAAEAVSVVPAGYIGIDAKAPLPGHDIARAKALLKEAGYENGVTIKAVHTANSTMLPPMEVVQAQLKRAGIDLQMTVVDHATFHAQIRKDLSDVVYYHAGGRFPSADIFLTQFFHSASAVGAPTAVVNFSHCNVADREIEGARTERDAARQNALWKEAQRKIIEAACAVPLFDVPLMWARRNSLDYGFAPVGALSLGHLITEQATLKAK
ncbi:peptide/nickel transport system substrate-binding protein [Stella humosa]|uniref:Peptide/nickel transport system substrate-binding protein n=1 Tax=Stella humosa TaxID=94 RepID=A0A3N1KRU9_9PROT|nr:ABC transporter substrate-binding protein [Stella humosa]ROP81110.1 peptide/nickel transport system substrate-binding protein [Stella humosa]BBK32455.1 hypothetical protein STHU_30890 [Stella humosa]